MQSLIAPTPGNTNLSDFLITSRSEETVMVSEADTASSALLTE